MLCDECNSNAACVHMIKIINGAKTEKHLCENCAASAGEACFSAAIHFSVNDFVKAMFEQELTEATAEEIACPNCGMVFSDFGRSGKIGCNVCYGIFHEQLEPVLRRVHGISNHTGKIPNRAGNVIRLRLQVKGLRKDLEQCVETENYEKAAAIRDNIRLLEKQLDLQGVDANGD